MKEKREQQLPSQSCQHVGIFTRVYVLAGAYFSDALFVCVYGPRCVIVYVKWVNKTRHWNERMNENQSWPSMIQGMTQGIQGFDKLAISSHGYKALLPYPLSLWWSLRFRLCSHHTPYQIPTSTLTTKTTYLFSITSAYQCRAFRFIPFAVADTRLYTLPCRYVGTSVGNKYFWIASDFCITAPA